MTCIAYVCGVLFTTTWVIYIINTPSTRFSFHAPTVLELQAGAAGFQLSNPPVFECLSLKASLDVFAETSMRELTTKSRILTGYLEMLIEQYLTKEKVKPGTAVFVKTCA